eukprot:12478074-Alexandrium_andersonii.AAC.1
MQLAPLPPAQFLEHLALGPLLAIVCFQAGFELAAKIRVPLELVVLARVGPTPGLSHQRPLGAQPRVTFSLRRLRVGR